MSSLISDNQTESSNSIKLKTLIPTRWAGRYDAIFALKIRFVEVQKALAKTILLSCKAEEKNEAMSLKKKIKFYCATSLPLQSSANYQWSFKSTSV